MVDEIRQPQRRYGTLSESSSDDDEHSPDPDIHSESSDDSSGQLPSPNVPRSKKQIPNELREVFECDPELYGIRRSGRSRKEPMRFEPPKMNDPDRHRNRRHVISSESSSRDSSDSSFHTRVYRSRTTKYSCRTRGNLVDYKKAFNDESDSDEYDIPQPDRRKRNQSDGQTPFSTARKQMLFQKRKGSLIRSSIKESERRNFHQYSKQLDTSDADSLSYLQKRKISDSNDEEESPNEKSQKKSAFVEGDEEVDVIEEILTHALRRVGATGNPTTLYNCRMEQDPNEGFDPSVEEGEIQYLIKWRSWSHLHSTWETEASLTSPERSCVVDGLKRLQAYKASVLEREQREKIAEKDELDALVYEDERNALILSDKMDVDRIVAHSRDKVQGSFDYLIKWRRLDYRYCTWESGAVIDNLFRHAVEIYKNRCKSTTQPNLKHPALLTRPKFFRVSLQPEYLGAADPNLQLRDYQLKGLNWIVHAWTRGNSVILADEMGLGKTVQAVSFLSYLFHEHRLYGPFLLVVPLSTVCSWQSELELWGPQMNAITYTGDHISRQLIREHEWSSPNGNTVRKQQILKFNVCLTTYEILLKDKSWLGQVSWAVLAVDEAHRLKNDASQLYKSLFSFNTNMRLLITGTPLQNSLKELWSLLHFLMPNKFPFWEEFESDYSLQNQNNKLNSDGYEVIRNLHRLLEPFLLRRVKKDVEQSLPAKTEQILRVEMSKRQATIYRLILARNYEGLMKVTRGHRASFINIVMELKKCCNHSYLIAPKNESDSFSNNPDQLRELLEGSGKLILLDKLLLKLKPKGHRVLIFSQMVRMLDIIADYLRLRNWSFQRLDGSIRGELRKQSLDHFNSEGSTDFCFLLSTRAGGLGINLATADTVVIFDSDWNPQNDIQAQARAHRIGQTKQVSVYRLVVKDSVEEKIIECATRKMLLDHLVIQRMESSGGRASGKKTDSKGQLLTEILRHGAEGLFKPNEDEKEVEVDIDAILNCAETRDVDVSDEAHNPANALLSTFNIVTLDQLEYEETNPVEMEQAGRSAVGRSWSEIIPTDLREQAMSEENKNSLIDLELGPRLRKQVKAYQAGLDNDENLSSSESDRTTDDKCICKFSDKEVRALVRAMKRFARPLERIDAIAAEAELPDKTSNEVREVVEAVIKGCKSAMDISFNKITEDSTEANLKNRGPIFYYGKVAVAAKPLLQSINELEILHKCLPVSSKEDRLNYELPFLPKSVNWSSSWDAKDDVHLLVGVYEHGYDNWEAIKLDADLGLGSKLLPPSSVDRPQSNHIRTRVDYLLKFLTKSAQKSECATTSHRNFKPKSKNSIEDTDSSTRKTLKRHSDCRTTDAGRSSEYKPKSAEFVESDDTSSESGNEPELSASSKLEKSKSHHQDLKRSKQGDRLPPDMNKKTKRKIPAKESEPLHFTAQREPVSISKEEEEEFHQMRGPLFAECKNKLYPVKKQLKQLECLEDDDMTDTEQYDRAIMRIGDHITSLTNNLVHKHERHSWRGFYWEFVQNFSKKGTSELQHLYRSAIKREKKFQEKEKRNKSNEIENTQFTNNGEERNRHISEQSAEVQNSNANIRIHKRDHISEHSRFKQQYENHSVNLDSHAPFSIIQNRQSENPRGNTRHENWSHDRPRHRRSEARPNHSGNFPFDRKYDRFNNAFNRPSPNINNQPYSEHSSILRPPPLSIHDHLISPAAPLNSWPVYPNPFPPIALPTASIIPPPILLPHPDPSTNLPFPRDPRLASSNRP